MWANNTLKSPPHKAVIPQNRNARNSEVDRQDKDKETTSNGQIWHSSNCRVSMARTRQTPRYSEEEGLPKAVSMSDPINLITQPTILTRGDLTRWLQEDFVNQNPSLNELEKMNT